MTTFLPGWRHPHIWEGALLVAYKRSPKQHDKDMVTSNWVVSFISCQGPCTHNEWPYPEFQLTATNFVSMAAKLSDLVDEISGANLQAEGHVDVPTQSAKDLWEMEAVDSPPSCLPSWSPAQRLPSSFPSTKYCLEICVTLTEELGDIPPPSHSWKPPLVEDMLCNARTGLTKAVVTGPGRAVLFLWEAFNGGRAWPQTRLEMPHSYSQELVCGWKNWPTLPQTHWQFKRVKGPLLKPYQIVELRQGDQDIPR